MHANPRELLDVTSNSSQSRTGYSVTNLIAQFRAKQLLFILIHVSGIVFRCTIGFVTKTELMQWPLCVDVVVIRRLLCFLLFTLPLSYI